MKIVNLWSCCPVAEVGEDRVEIGEEGNLHVLAMEEWEILKSKPLLTVAYCAQQYFEDSEIRTGASPTI